jgi:hypothetical protein
LRTEDEQKAENSVPGVEDGSSQRSAPFHGMTFSEGPLITRIPGRSVYGPVAPILLGTSNRMSPSGGTQMIAPEL